MLVSATFQCVRGASSPTYKDGPNGRNGYYSSITTVSGDLFFSETDEAATLHVDNMVLSCSAGAGDDDFLKSFSTLRRGDEFDCVLDLSNTNISGINRLSVSLREVVAVRRAVASAPARKFVALPA